MGSYLSIVLYSFSVTILFYFEPGREFWKCFLLKNILKVKKVHVYIQSEDNQDQWCLKVQTNQNLTRNAHVTLCSAFIISPSFFQYYSILGLFRDCE